VHRPPLRELLVEQRGQRVRSEKLEQVVHLAFFVQVVNLEVTEGQPDERAHARGVDFCIAAVVEPADDADSEGRPTNTNTDWTKTK
jgi:hypothetical protein